MSLEEWKPIKEYDGHYEVSNLGNVRNSKGKILKLQTDSNGYKRVNLYKKGYKVNLVHRLVASAFIENPLNKLCVNHIDNDRTNNNVNNLEWVSYEENMQWASIQGRMNPTEETHRKLREAKKNITLPVIATDKDGNKYFFEKLTDVESIGLYADKVALCCRGKRKTSGNMSWEFVDKEIAKTMKPTTLTKEQALKIRNGYYQRKENKNEFVDRNHIGY